MRRSKFHNGIKLVTDNMKNDILPLTEKALQHLKQTHPPRHNFDLEVLLPEVHPVTC